MIIYWKCVLKSVCSSVANNSGNAHKFLLLGYSLLVNHCRPLQLEIMMGVHFVVFEHLIFRCLFFVLNQCAAKLTFV